MDLMFQQVKINLITCVYLCFSYLCVGVFVSVGSAVDQNECQSEGNLFITSSMLKLGCGCQCMCGIGTGTGTCFSMGFSPLCACCLLHVQQ